MMQTNLQNIFFVAHQHKNNDDYGIASLSQMTIEALANGEADRAREYYEHLTNLLVIEHIPNLNRLED